MEDGGWEAGVGVRSWWGGIAPEWDMTDSILTSRLAAGDSLVLTIHVLCPIIKPYFFFFFFDMTQVEKLKKKRKKATTMI